jgi:hypothetical protein
MRSIQYWVLVSAVAAGAAAAQPSDAPRGPRLMDIESLVVLLDLDAYQKGEVERVLTEQRDTMIGARAQRNTDSERPSFEEMQARREQLRQDTLAKLTNVLSEQQIAKLDLLMDRAGPRGPRRAFLREGAKP